MPKCTSNNFLCSYVRRIVRLSARTVNLMLGRYSQRRRCQRFSLQVLLTLSRCNRLVFLLKAWSQFRVSLFCFISLCWFLFSIHFVGPLKRARVEGSEEAQVSGIVGVY